MMNLFSSNVLNNDRIVTSYIKEVFSDLLDPDPDPLVRDPDTSIIKQKK
jgi:hypothetical protein